MQIRSHFPSIQGIFQDKKYWHTIYTIGLPVALQNLFSAGLNLVDSVMVGNLGDASLAAVGIANTVFFLMIVFMFGIGSGCAIFIAQFFGRGDKEGVRKTMAIGIVSGVVVSGFFLFISLLFHREILSIFTDDKEVIGLSTDFLLIVCFSFPLSAISNVFYSGLRSVKKASLPLLVSAAAIILNTFLNIVLINGYLGFPRLGVRGSAIATLVSRILEIVILFIAVYAKKYPIAIRFRDFRAVDRIFLYQILRVTTPVVLNEGLWSLGVSTFTVLFSRMGTEHIAAYNILSTIDRLSFSLSMGIAAATAAMVGHRIGEGNKKAAYTYAARTNIIGVLIGTLIGIVLFFLRHEIVSFFAISDEASGYALILITVFSFALPIKTFNLENLLGALRAGGDTRFAFLAEILPLWLVAVPAAFAAGLWGALPLAVVYLFCISDEAIKAIVGMRRFLSQKWINELGTTPEIEREAEGV